MVGQQPEQMYRVSLVVYVGHRSVPGGLDVELAVSFR
jgi:hypothetical protein